MKKSDFAFGMILGFVIGFALSRLFDAGRADRFLVELEMTLKEPDLTACDWSVIESTLLPGGVCEVALITKDGFEKDLIIHPSHKQFAIFENLENGDCIRFYYTDEEMDPEDLALQFIKVEFLESSRKDYQRLTGRLRRPVFYSANQKPA